MARAKRTDRAEARRKYRAYLQAQEEAAAAEARGSEDEPEAVGSKPARSRDQKPQPTIPPGAQLGIFAAARAATRQATYIDDVRNIRSLVFGSKAVWPVLVVCVASGAYTAARLSSGDWETDPILPLVVQFIFLPIPLLPPMLAGFLAPRSTWLAGAIAAFIATMTLVTVLAVAGGKLSDTAGSLAFATATPSVTSGPIAAASATPVTTALSTSTSEPTGTPAQSATSGQSAAPSAGPSASAAPSAGPSSSANPGSNSTTNSSSNSSLPATALALLAQSLAFGALMGAGSGWYKRFLSLTSAPRNKTSSRSGGKRSSQRRPAARK